MLIIKGFYSSSGCVTMAATGYCYKCRGPSRAYRYSTLLGACRCFLKKNSQGFRSERVLADIAHDEELNERRIFLENEGRW